MRSIKTALSAIPVLILLAACGTSTPYSSAQDGSGYGFSEQRIEKNRYRMTFRGNSLTPRETVENYLLYRAAELTLQKGYDYFVIVSDDTEKTTTYRTTPSTGYMYYGYGRPFPYYGYGWRWARGMDGPDIRSSTRYSAIAYVVMYDGEKPGEAAAYDAADVVDSLRGSIQRPE